MKTITVFGASNPSEQEWEDAEYLGRKISMKGYTLKNGGYGGIMEASAKGCVQTGGEVIGVCIEGNVGEWGIPNQYSTEIIFVPTINKRIEELLRTDAVITLPGSLGTLDELTSAWACKHIEDRYQIYIWREK